MKRSALLLMLLMLAPASVAQEADSEKPESPDVRPAPTDGPLGLPIPEGVEPTPPRAELLSHNGDVVRVLAEFDDKLLVKRPSGALELVAANDASPTAGPFRSASIETVVDSLRDLGLGDFKTERRGYYLFAYKSTEAYYLHTRSILESMLKGVVGQLRDWGLNPSRPETPLVVIIFPNRKEFDAFDKMPRGVAAYYNGVTNHVVLYEDDRLFDAAPEFALKQGSYVVAHEAIHQLLHNTGIQKRLSAWPAWISEGAPEYFCPLRVNSSLARLDGDQLPVRTVKWSEAGMVNDIRMHDLLRTSPANGELIRETVSASGLTAHGYSVAWGLTHFLAERKPKQFAAYLADVQEIAAGSRVVPPSRGPDPLFVKHFGDDFPVLEREVQRHLTSKPIQDSYRDPFVHQTHYVVSVTFKRRRVYYTKAGLALSPTAARDWTREQKKLLRAEGIDAHVVTRECRTAREARYHLRKILD